MLTPAWQIGTGEGAKLVHVNATATGGGVAELLHSLVPGQRAEGTNAGWAVIAGTETFYSWTKYLHHLLHGRADPTRLDDPEFLEVYRAVLGPQGRWLAERVTSGDVVVLHDPQTLGLAPHLSRSGARVLWHCHIGADVAGNKGPAAVWNALAAELSTVDGVITTLPEFAPPSVPVQRRYIAAPAIDPQSPKNRALDASEVRTLLDAIGLTSEHATTSHTSVLQRTTLHEDARMVLQVSRWDPLKDMPGVLRCISDLPADTHLVLAGTDPTQIPDDPEGLAVFAEVTEALESLEEHDQRRVHLVTTSMHEPENNALVVNALQRRADIVVQKSLEEGFGLTVAEALVKKRAVVASNVGGLRSQISHNRTGLLVDPTDRAEVVTAITTLLNTPDLRREFGDRGAELVQQRFTVQRLINDYRTFACPGEVADHSSEVTT